MKALLDQSLSVLLEGYGWLPNRWRRGGGEPVRARVLGRRATGLRGPEDARFFYDEKHIRRRGAIPGPVLSTLFGHGAVHTLDGDAHHRRKRLFLSLMTSQSVAALTEEISVAWDEADWSAGKPVTLFEQASHIITRAVTRWSGVPLRSTDVPSLASDLIAMVDGFATAGPRHWRARAARRRQERWLAAVIEDVRAGALTPSPEQAISVVATHLDADGPLSPRVAAVELLNVIRPTVAVAWFVTFAAHALHRWPEHAQPLRDGRHDYATAFVQELRRFYPFAPFVGGKAVSDLSWRGADIPAGSLVLLDLYGHNHDDTLWPDPYSFDPARFAGRAPGEFELVPQGGGDPATNHRCPGEAITIAVLETLVPRLAAMDYRVPPQDLRISLRRIPARPASGFVVIPR
ncbi:cytochrome P450 [Fodinicola acaciae]|uniref:cytochrome P450 n=1 Tax=Fodinicola acaciae TaxID=2681555 RepID=UPI0013D64ADF|nr:cytochrome P450 [Fodinicola acaciae]